MSVSYCIVETRLLVVLVLLSAKKLIKNATVIYLFISCWPNYKMDKLHDRKEEKYAFLNLG